MHSTAPRIVHVMVTGGPSCELVPSVAHLRERLPGHGWAVLAAPQILPEILPWGVTAEAWDRVVAAQLLQRRRLERAAQSLGAARVAVIHVRGVPDAAAHLSAAEYTEVLLANGLGPAAAYDLYDLVVHLRPAPGTAIVDSERIVSASSDQESQEATLAAWMGHPHLVVIAHRPTLEATLAAVVETVLSAVGDPVPVETERKFLLNGPANLAHPVLAAAAVVDIEQVYLPRTGAGEERIRSRTLAQETQYTHTLKTDIGNGSRLEVETRIDLAQYRQAFAQRDPAAAVLRKRRYLFVDLDQRFELDHITGPITAWLLEAEVANLSDPVQVPAFLGPVIDVTHDPAWRNSAVAGRHAGPYEA